MNQLKNAASIALGLLLLATTGGSICAQDNVGFDKSLLKVQDQLLLKSGAELSGTIESVPAEKSEPVSFESSAGDTLILDRELISKIEKVDSVAQHYNEALAAMEDDAQSHRDMITWCEEQDRGRSRFRSQILFHRKRIIFFEPDDRSSRTKLGYTYLKDENRWVDKEQYWSQQGYDKQGDSTLFENTRGKLAESNSQLIAKKKKFTNWGRNLGRMSRREAVDSLVAIADPQLMPTIYEKFSDTNDPELRAVYAEVFAAARPTTTSAVRGLVTAVMDDGSDIALDYLRQEDFNRGQIASFLSRFLASKNRQRIQRAGFALGELELTQATLALSQALITRHQVQAAVANSGASRTQSSAGGDSFQFGGQKAQSRDFQNEAVFNALRKITGQDFGYAQEPYQKWYVQNFTHVGLKARRGSSHKLGPTGPIE